MTSRYLQDVHNPTPTPCPLCGKIFSSKHKMFGHKYRSCPNRTRNLVRHLEDMDTTGSRPAAGQAAGQSAAGIDANAATANAAGTPPRFCALLEEIDELEEDYGAENPHLLMHVVS